MKNQTGKRQTEIYIQGASPELTVGENSKWVGRIVRAFPAFGSRNYQLYFTGQLISLIGTWLQLVAQGWLVLQMTNSAFLIGLVSAIGLAPILILSLVGGVIIDHFPKKYILLFTQTASMILAFILGILTVTGHINIYEIMILAFLLGVVNALDSPTRQAYVSELVDKPALTSAIALNSGIYNAARIIGPGIAGLLIAWVGTGGAFIMNGVSYIAVIIALLCIKTSTSVEHTGVQPLKAIQEGLQYAWRHEVIRNILLYLSVVSIFAWSYTAIMPVIAKQAFHADASGLGYLYAATGVGAICATFFVSAWSGKISKLFMIIAGNMMFALSIFLFTCMQNFIFSLVCLFFAGFGLLTISACLNTSVQSRVEESFRGRVMSIYVLVYVGFMPFGSLEVGFLTEQFGWTAALRLSAVIVFLCGLYIMLNRKMIYALRDKYSS